jgi:threonine/homoserine/homoserine lactone efflux protein
VDTGSILAFTGVAAVLTITPGIDMALVTRSALTVGRRPTFATTLGIITGLAIWGAASAVGIAALLAASATAFGVLKLVGAAYLVYLGVQTLWRARTRTTHEDASPVGAREMPAGAAFRQGLLSNLLNPKIAVFYTTLLPQFVVAGDPVLAKSLLLTGIHVAMGLVWLTAYAWLVTRAGDLLRRPRARRALEAISGSVLVGLGIGLALERR